MKVKTLSIFLIAVLLGVLAARLLRHVPQTAHDTSATNAVTETSGQASGSQAGSQGTATATSQAQSMPRSPQEQGISNSQDDWASKPLPPGSNLEERLAELSRERGVPLNVLTQQALTHLSNFMQATSQRINQPIEFYGKAVNENGAPLSGATVRFGCIIYPESHFTTNVLTDADGMFALENVTGAILNVRVSKGGYEEEPGTNQNRFAYYSPTGSGFYPNRDNPVIFHLRKKAAE